MLFKIIKPKNADLFIIKTSGEFSVNDHSVALKAFFLHPDWYSGVPLVMDNRDCCFESISLNDIDCVVTFVTMLEEKFGASRCAIVMPDSGISKASIYKFMAEMKNRPPELKVFTSIDYEEAVNWAAGFTYHLKLMG